MNKKNVIVSVNGVEKERITVDEAKKKGKEMSPMILSNTFFEKTREIAKKARENSDSRKLDLKSYIDFLQGIYDEFGNMPVLGYRASSDCFYNCELSDIDVVKQHFTLSGDIKYQYMNIREDKALSIFHS